MDYAFKISELLLKLGCVKFEPANPFTYASGLKGPIYCDNRKLLSSVEARDLVSEAMLSLIETENFNFDLLGGVATGGIPYSAILADRLKRPMVYIRSKPKAHGKGQQVEGAYSPGQTVLMIEDLVNQGASLEAAVIGAKNASLAVDACISIVDYQMKKAQERLSENSVKLFSLTDFSKLTEVAKQLNLIDEQGFEILKSWQSDPENWSY